MNTITEDAFVPRLLDGTVHVPHVGDAYIRVRLSEPVRNARTVTVYLVDGTAIDVPEHDVIRLTSVDYGNVSLEATAAPDVTAYPQ
jgi:hypothetical protein